MSIRNGQLLLSPSTTPRHSIGLNVRNGPPAPTLNPNQWCVSVKSYEHGSTRTSCASKLQGLPRKTADSVKKYEYGSSGRHLAMPHPPNISQEPCVDRETWR